MKYAFDIEVYPNFFSMIARNVITNKKYEFVIFEDRDDRQQLKQFLSSNPTLIGYNSKDFDMPVLNYFMTGVSLEETYQFSSSIINKKRFEKMPTEYYRLRDNDSIEGIDLMRVLSIDGMGVSLKQCAILLKWPTIQELPFPPDSLINKEDVPKLLSYNDNDVLITLELYKRSLDDIKLREFITQEYEVDVMNNSESFIANDLITQLYARETSMHPMVFRELRTKRDIVPVSHCIGKNICFISSKMQNFLSEFKTKSIDLRNEKKKKECIVPEDINGVFQVIDFETCIPAINEIVQINQTKYQIGVGGLHSIDTPAVFESSNSMMLIDADVASFYPYIMLNNAIKPAHLHDCFLNILERLVKQRIEYKAEGEALWAYVLKIVINSIFGKLGSDKFWLYDPLAFYSVTISGQLYLLSLIDRLENNGIEVISANTDGIICYIDRRNFDRYMAICGEWQEETNFKLEFIEYDKYIRRDVNNYAAKSFREWRNKNGVVSSIKKEKFKSKGAFEDITSIPFQFGVRKRYNMPIVQKALKGYFFENKSVENVVKSSNSIHDFLMTQKPGKKFYVEYDGQRVQRINRFFISTNGAQLYKIEHENPDRKLSLVADEIELANDIEDDHISNYPNIDYKYYIHEVEKIVNKIQPPTTKNTLF